MSDKAGYDNSHPYIQIKILPESVIKFRRLLQEPENADLLQEAHLASDFENALACVAMKLGVVVDGYYDVADFCTMLVAHMERRAKTTNKLVTPLSGVYDVTGKPLL